MNDEIQQPTEEKPKSEADSLRERADDLGMFGWFGIAAWLIGTGAGVVGLLNSAVWWPAAVAAGSFSLMVALALFLFSHLTHIRASLADRER